MKSKTVKIVIGIVMCIVVGYVVGRVYYETKMVSNVGILERGVVKFINWLGEEGE